MKVNGVELKTVYVFKKRPKHKLPEGGVKVVKDVSLKHWRHKPYQCDFGGKEKC